MHNVEVGDVVQYQMNNGLVLCWKVDGFFLGGIGEESVVKLKSFGRKKNMLDKPILIPSQLFDAMLVSNTIKIFKPIKKVSFGLEWAE